VTFAYDAFGRRILKKVSTPRGSYSVRYVWDGNDLLHELREGREVVTWEFEPGSFQLLAKVVGKQRFGAVSDYQGKTLALYEEDGDLAWLGEIDLWGQADIDVEQTKCPWRFLGQYEDDETGFFYNRFRYYDPFAGRYISRDPLGLLGGLNLFIYVPDPLHWVDPFGLAKCGVGPYNQVGGHHIHAKAGFIGHAKYNWRKALSISRDYMAKLGVWHDDITTAQRVLFTEFLQSGKPNTLAEHSRIALEALVKANVPRKIAQDLVQQSEDDLIAQGVTAPTRIPWGP
jgi:RHS repeat-associated protein